ncbi:hypothetical protein NB688_003850 [Xanthomonas sacchari]|nr:hypothetical protein [Xanthomonas sacchari]
MSEMTTVPIALLSETLALPAVSCPLWMVRSPAACMVTSPCAAMLLAVRVMSPWVVLRLALPPTDSCVPVMVSVWPLPLPFWL